MIASDTFNGARFVRISDHCHSTVLNLISILPRAALIHSLRLMLWYSFLSCLEMIHHSPCIGRALEVGLSVKMHIILIMYCNVPVDEDLT
jgi:hypothetical protein